MAPNGGVLYSRYKLTTWNQNGKTNITLTLERHRILHFERDIKVDKKQFALLLLCDDIFLTHKRYWAYRDIGQ